MVRSRGHRSRGGWSLVEVAVACAVIAGIAAGGAQLGLAHDAAVRSSHAEHLALRAALAALDGSVLPPADVTRAVTSEFSPVAPDGTSVVLRGERTVRVVAPRLAEVTVVVTVVGSGSGSESVTLTRRIAFEESPR